MKILTSGERLVLGILTVLAAVLVFGALSVHFAIAVAITATVVILPWLIWGLGLAWQALKPTPSGEVNR